MYKWKTKIDSRYPYESGRGGEREPRTTAYVPVYPVDLKRELCIDAYILSRASVLRRSPDVAAFERERTIG